MSNRWPNLTCASLLLASCIYGIWMLKGQMTDYEKPYTAIGLLLYLTHALLTLIVECKETNNENARKWADQTFFLTLAGAVGFLLISAFLKSGTALARCFLNLGPLFVETVNANVKLADRKYTSTMVEIAHGISVGCMLYLATNNPVLYIAPVGTVVAQVFREEPNKRHYVHLAESAVVAGFVEYLK